MTRLHYVKSARKTIRGTGVRKGRPYYWYKFYGCPKQYSLAKPRRSSYATRSEFVAAMMDLEDEMENVPGDSAEDARAFLEDIRDQVDELKDAEDEKLSAVQDRFPNGCPTAELLQTRVDGAQSTVDSLETAINALSGDDAEDELTAILADITWEYE